MGIYVNQIGYPLYAAKSAVTTMPGICRIFKKTESFPVFETAAKPCGMDLLSGEEIWTMDFTSVEQPGIYYIMNDANERSPLFSIGEYLYKDLKNDLIKALYFQRCGCYLSENHAGAYTHSLCHGSPAIFLEDYISHEKAPETYDMTGGWHDAGDFGRYVTAGAVAVAHLLYAFELFPEGFTEPLNIPETGNDLPDLLNECLYEINWMFKMQAPDGGVYHKLTSFQHADFVMPEDDHRQFLIYPVSSMATADFAAVMSLTARVYAPYRPDLSVKALLAAKKAWDWLSCNPYTAFHNPEGSNTGEYGDDCDDDERMWAAAELLRTDPTHSASYKKELSRYAVTDMNKTDMGWTDVSGLALLTTLFDPGHHAGKETESVLIEALYQDADLYLKMAEANGYGLSMTLHDFCWGSNMVVCNRSMLFILASILSETDGQKYKKAALEQLHYLLGKNALNISYVTGYGENAFKNPHNRPTFADGIELPMSGWVSGGPNQKPCDEKAIELIPSGTPPMKCYIDHVESYSTNEITIYWNSPAVFITAYFDRDSL